MTILANIYDINNCTIPQGKNFIVDTNSLIWTYYSKASLSAIRYQVISYPQFIQDLLSDNKLHVCSLTISEIARVVQKLERELCEQRYSTQISVKKFRSDYPSEWTDYIQELELTIQQIESTVSNLSIEVNGPFNDDACNLLKKSKLDMFDCYIVGYMNQHGITNIITDDTDFACVAGINVFTANNRIIGAARSQSKLYS